MKKVTITKEGYLIDKSEMGALAGELAANIRLNFRTLKRIGRISYKEHQHLERELDKILYPIEEKK